MKQLYKNYLFQKHILVSETKNPENTFETLFSLANLFAIRITDGQNLADASMIRYASSQLGEKIPAPFYKGFPESVRALTVDELIYDQMLHYWTTYGLGDFSEVGHSVFEEQLERTAFKENVKIKDFRILPEKEALKLVGEMVTDLLAGSRPLNEQSYLLCLNYIRDFRQIPEKIASKNTAILLLLDLRDPEMTKFLKLSDVIKVVDELNHKDYKNDNIRKLNLKNQDRVFLTKIINRIISDGKCDLAACFEKKHLWNGFLHHIHFRAKSEEAEIFADAMRGRENRSVYSTFELKMEAGDVRGAAQYLKNEKGSGAVLRNLNYLISRCENEDDVTFVTECLDTRNVIILIQLLIQYENYRTDGSARTFTFTKFNKLKAHTETGAEIAKRRSVIRKEQAAYLADLIRNRLKELLRGRVGTVYIDPAMASYALPVQENTSQGGFGVLPKGTRLPIGEAKILRAFTYWEKVNDIDLSVIGIDGDGRQMEFSWRTMARRQSKAITYSGDETSGYNGGSEYFDINLELFRQKYPDIRYLIFCDNVFSGIPFSACFCKAGYMLRDKIGSGEIYEPKTVESAFVINCESRFAYLFGVDLASSEFIWLNVGRSSTANVAGETRLDFLLDYFHTTDVINMKTFFEMCAEKVTDRLEEADVIVTNHSVDAPEGAEVIREYNFEKVISLMR
ncbi:MAG: hypothetical protein E7240_09575 [Lachnospiraceae bacterium]|nr:hypothetical protein [Lachnospiraceae bacterium]